MSEQTSPTGVRTSPPDTAATPADAPAPAWRRILSGSAGRNLGLVVALLLIVIAGAIAGGGDFTKIDNILTILRQASIVGVISVGMTLVIIAGGIDLSVGSVLGLASVVATLAAVQDLADDTHWILMIV
ncbi:MAG: sugar transporter permease, partial [Microbacterium sp.]|nr:sugar transporter permease [Microbacterium sp.]